MNLLKITKQNFATKLQAASTKNKSTTKGKRFGLKKFEFNQVYPLDVLVTQKGFKFKPGLNTYYGKDCKILASCEGVMRITKSFVNRKTGPKKVTTLHVVPHQQHMSNDIYPGVFNYHPEQYPELAKFNTEPFTIEKKEKNIRVEKPLQYKLVDRDAKIKIPDSYFGQIAQENEEKEKLKQMENFEQSQYLHDKRLDRIHGFMQSLNQNNQSLNVNKE